MCTLFIDPDYPDRGEAEEGEGDRSTAMAAHAFELVFADGTRVKLQHGMLLISRAGGQTWEVQRIANGGGDDSSGGSGSATTTTGLEKEKTRREVRFFAADKVVRATCSNSPGLGRDEGDVRAMTATVHSYIGLLASTDGFSRRDAVAMFASKA